jgi:hypothetical protein
MIWSSSTHHGISRNRTTKAEKESKWSRLDEKDWSWKATLPRRKRCVSDDFSNTGNAG